MIGGKRIARQRRGVDVRRLDIKPFGLRRDGDREPGQTRGRIDAVEHDFNVAQLRIVRPPSSADD